MTLPPTLAVSYSCRPTSTWPLLRTQKEKRLVRLLIASASLSSNLHDLDLLLKSGVLRQSNAIVLSQPGPHSDKEELGFLIGDLFARFQIEDISCCTSFHSLCSLESCVEVLSLEVLVAYG
ncbi:hypothetical protein NE237_026951 [Protea cynaroides]|uniref:Uncharacterized protein n=1 Tax=Protea cynaroides TaxID=273540 RepID=A0A9Q0JRG7_9MAGN|nr:hypothetical protein NE237_026951 [Protea cynaroides]